MVKLDEQLLDAVFGALAHPIRRDIVRRLGQGPAHVGDLAAPHGVSLAAISKHLDVLEQAGLLQRSREGRHILCSLQREAIQQAASWVDGQSGLRAQQLAELEQLAEQLRAPPRRRRSRGKKANQEQAE